MVPQPPRSVALAIQQAVLGRLRGRPVGSALQTASGDEIRLALWGLEQYGKADVVARAACGALQELLLTNEDRQAAIDANVVSLLTATLVHHGATRSVVLDGLSALLRLGESEQAQGQLMHRNVLRSLVCVLRQLKSEEEVLAAGLAMLVWLSGFLKSRPLLSAAQAPELAIDAMLTHPKSVAIQSMGCELLYHLADSSEAQQHLLALGAVEMVTEAVRQFPHNQKLQQRALPTLCRLCETEQTRILIGMVGGVVAVLRAVDNHHEDLVIARHGCTLLWELALCAALLQPMVTADVEAVLNRVLQRHPRDAVLTTHGRALLWRMASGAPPTKPGNATKQAVPPPTAAPKRELPQHTVSVSLRRRTAVCRAPRREILAINLNCLRGRGAAER